MAFHDYSEGMTQISREYGNGIHTLWYRNPSGGGLMFVDHTRGGGLTNRRAAPTGASNGSFAHDPATPSIIYLVVGGQIRRYDVATNSYADIAPFPAAFPASGWFQQDMTDSKFIASGGGSVTFYDRTTNTVISRAFTGLDAPYLEKNGRYVMANTSLRA